MTQMRWRFEEGTTGQVAFYRIGVEDHGNPRGLPDAELSESLFTLKRMADANKVCPDVGMTREELSLLSLGLVCRWLRIPGNV